MISLNNVFGLYQQHLAFDIVTHKHCMPEKLHFKWKADKGHLQIFVLCNMSSMCSNTTHVQCYQKKRKRKNSAFWHTTPIYWCIGIVTNQWIFFPNAQNIQIAIAKKSGPEKWSLKDNFVTWVGLLSFLMRQIHLSH